MGRGRHVCAGEHGRVRAGRFCYASARRAALRATASPSSSRRGNRIARPRSSPPRRHAQDEFAATARVPDDRIAGRSTRCLGAGPSDAWAWSADHPSGCGIRRQRTPPRYTHGCADTANHWQLSVGGPPACDGCEGAPFGHQAARNRCSSSIRGSRPTWAPHCQISGGDCTQRCGEGMQSAIPCGQLLGPSTQREARRENRRSPRIRGSWRPCAPHRQIAEGERSQGCDEGMQSAGPCGQQVGPSGWREARRGCPHAAARELNGVKDRNTATTTLCRLRTLTASVHSPGVAQTLGTFKSRPGLGCRNPTLGR
mmetsp:Transcript_33004/g.82404  ORF Transcript_33004/g.82404 Transcript_33004/m.82404 type:complete len:312 (+) Transcript_33004:754-1689(+)